MLLVGIARQGRSVVHFTIIWENDSKEGRGRGFVRMSASWSFVDMWGMVMCPQFQMFSSKMESNVYVLGASVEDRVLGYLDTRLVLSS